MPVALAAPRCDPLLALVVIALALVTLLALTAASVSPVVWPVELELDSDLARWIAACPVVRLASGGEPGAPPALLEAPPDGENLCAAPRTPRTYGVRLGSSGPAA